MTEMEFEEKTVKEVQSILRRHHIIVTDMEMAPLKFDARGLATLASLSSVTHIQGV